jgi:hypothetical protein
MELAGKNRSAQALNYNEGVNDNTYCARCMSPLQFDPDVNRTTADTIAEENWTGIGCIICHDEHTLELSVYNGTGREEPVTSFENISTELCGKCHGGTDHHHIADDWAESAHADTYKGYNANTYCAHCMSPYQAGDEATQAARDPVSEENWTSIGCIVCHDQHSTESGLYNGSSFNVIEDVTELCGSCHTMGDATLGDSPHHPQYEMRKGIGGINVTTKTSMMSVDCADCHMLDASHTLEFELYECS